MHRTARRDRPYHASHAHERPGAGRVSGFDIFPLRFPTQTAILPTGHDIRDHFGNETAWEEKRRKTLHGRSVARCASHFGEHRTLNEEFAFDVRCWAFEVRRSTLAQHFQDMGEDVGVPHHAGEAVGLGADGGDEGGIRGMAGAGPADAGVVSGELA